MYNLLVKSENLIALKYLLDNRKMGGKVDLVYIDPPFATGNSFTRTDDRNSTISYSREGVIAYSDKLNGKEYIKFLRERLILLRDLLSERGSIYLHIDYKVGHYVKVMMDEVFGIENFRNDIARIKCNPKNFKRIGFGNVKDLVLFYTKSPNPIWNEPMMAYSDNDMDRLFPKTDASGRRYTTVPIHAPGETVSGASNMPFRGMLPPRGRHWRTNVKTLEKWDMEGLIEWSSTGNPRKKIYADEKDGKRVQDIWEFKDPQYPCYPTEKNEDMLDLIIRTSSDYDSIVLDCFCGSGTTLKAAQMNGRRWIGIDQSEYAINATLDKLTSTPSCLFSSNTDYKLIDLDETQIDQAI